MRFSGIYKPFKGIIAFILLLSFPLIACAQSNIAAPMKDSNQVVDNTLDSLNLARTARPLAGSTRKGDNPVLFLVGNSTMRTGTLGNGNNGQWGWGYFAPDFFDESKITVENHALGGTSSRTFYNKLWPEVLAGVKKGDWVAIELGHNDNGPYDSGRARASIPGIGCDSLQVTIQETGVKETVYSYGEYMRRFIHDVKQRGAFPLLVSLTPRNAWVDEDSTIIERVADTYGLWAKEVASEEAIPFIDLNEITALKFEIFGKDKVKDMFYLDRIHTSEFGAMLNAESFADGLRQYVGLELADYLKPVEEDLVSGSSRSEGCPMLFLAGDSTVKIPDNDTTGRWGWGSVIDQLFDTDRISIENHARSGRSSRTFLEEGLWDKIYNALEPGDYVLIQFGHNDSADINVGKAKGSLPGVSEESKVFKMENTGRYKVIYTFGWYLRKFVRDVLEKGATPILLSPTPLNKWDNGHIERNTGTYGGWTRTVADQMGVEFIDLNQISADRMEFIGLEEGLRKVNDLFQNDHTHTSKAGAFFNAESVAEGLRKSDSTLKNYLK